MVTEYVSITDKEKQSILAEPHKGQLCYLPVKVEHHANWSHGEMQLTLLVEIMTLRRVEDKERRNGGKDILRAEVNIINQDRVEWVDADILVTKRVW